MSAVMTSGIEGVSARYAAQIRELLYVHAIQRMAAEEEAARAEAEAEQAARLEAIRGNRIEAPVKVDADTAAKAAASVEPVKLPETNKDPAPAQVAPAQIFDLQA